jgi:glycosyltransferase involved in cell wall biosynthesis
MNQSVELSIVMPCLNESETLEICIKKAAAFLRDSGVSGEIVVGDNGSTDGSQEIARRNGARVVDVPIRGYGAALIHAISAARGRFVIMGDSDDSYDFTCLMPFLSQLRAGFDLVMGNRFRGGIKAGAMPWKNRWIGNPALSGIGRLLFCSEVRDFHCGLRGFSKAAFESMDLRTMGMEFASEMVIKAHIHGLRITEVPTTLSPDGRSRPPHLRPWRDGWRHLRLMLVFSPRWLFLIPGLLLMAMGSAAAVRIWAAPLLVGSVGFDIGTLIYALAFISIGFQSVTFAVFTKVFAIAEGLMPEDPRLNRLFRVITLETGLLLGAVITGAGLFGTWSAVSEWSLAGFGELNPSEAVRSIAPSAFAISLGFQIILSSFFLSVLGLRIDRGKRS